MALPTARRSLRLYGRGGVKGVDDGIEQSEKYGLNRLLVRDVARHHRHVVIKVEAAANVRLLFLIETLSTVETDDERHSRHPAERLADTDGFVKGLRPR